MTIPFVGRARELDTLTRMVGAGRHVVVTGRYGVGKTTLVREFAAARPDLGAQVLVGGISGAALRASRAGRATGDSRLIVFDDVTKVTGHGVRVLRDLALDPRCQAFVIVDEAVPGTDVFRLRAALNGAFALALGPVSLRSAEACFLRFARDAGLRRSTNDLRLAARSTNGYPLLMTLMLERLAQQSLPSALAGPVRGVQR